MEYEGGGREKRIDVGGGGATGGCQTSDVTRTKNVHKQKGNKETESFIVFLV